MIRVRDLRKDFEISKRGKGLSGALKGLLRRETETARALDGVSFDVAPGDLVGYIGPNGAGKSTTIKILSGIMRPSSGEVLVEGRVPWKDRIAHVRRIGVVFGQRTQLWWDLPVAESFDLVRSMYRVGKADYDSRFEELDGRLGLSPLLDRPVRQLSLGQRMRCELAAALLPGPGLLFLDEPTIGLDANAKLAMRDFVKRLNAERGTTVILTTHDMDDIEALARRVILLRGGRILFDGDMESLKAEAREERHLVLDLAEAAPPSPAVAGMRLVEAEGRRLRFAFDPRELGPAEAIARATKAFAVADLLVEAEPVERLIARVYGSA